MFTAFCATMFAACQVFEVNTADTAKGNLKELEAIAAAVIGFLADRGYAKSYLKSLIAIFIGTVIIFALGVGYLGSVIGYDKALAGGLYPFLLSEAFKIALAISIVPTISKLTK